MIKNGTTSISALYIGTTNIVKIYNGINVVYQKGPTEETLGPYYVGMGKHITVTSTLGNNVKVTLVSLTTEGGMSGTLFSGSVIKINGTVVWESGRKPATYTNIYLGISNDGSVYLETTGGDVGTRFTNIYFKFEKV